MKSLIKLLILNILLLPFSSIAQDTNEQAHRKPIAYLVSDAHLDTQWNWDVQTTIKTYVWNTLNQNLKLLNKYPDYVFNFEGGIKYSWMKEYFPREYELLKEQIAQGKWHVAGASWDANDVIVPSIESSIRNILLGQSFYRDEFGVESTDIFLPDCFGFGWTLPTIASHCGLIGFSSQKLGWRKHPFFGDEKIPFSIGLWKGVDGSEIMMAHGYSYVQKWGAEDLTNSELLLKRSEESPLHMVYHYYGTGDKGGSPNMTSVDAIENAVNKNGQIKTISATSDQLYKDLLPYSAHPELPEYSGELLMDVHGTGCYTSQAAMKLYNRQNELLGDAAERAAVAASLLGVADYPTSALTDAWRRFIFHQFHDDLTGTSILRAYEYSWNDELLSLKQFSDILTHSISAVSTQLDTRAKGIPVVLFNALDQETTDIVEAQIPVKGHPGMVTVKDYAGNKTNAQIVEYNNGKATIIFEAILPPISFAVYDINFSGRGNDKPTIQNHNTIENSIYRITLDEKGDIISLFDKNDKRELVKPGKAIRLAIFTENESFTWPAWEILKETIDREPQSIDENVQMTLVENGPLRKTLCVEKTHEDSHFKQYIRLYEGQLADRIDFYNEVDWATTNALLKAEFPLNLDNEKACYDLGIGTIERGNNQDNAYEVYAQRWADLTDNSGEYGVTIMNDCKYGWDKPNNNTLRMTLIHTPKVDKRYIYHGKQDFGHHSFTYSLCGHKGSLNKADANKYSDALNQRVKIFQSDKHKGQKGKCYTIIHHDKPTISIKALKKAEKGDEYVIRIYETAGIGGEDTITFDRPILSAVTADGTEKTLETATFNTNNLHVSIGPNGLATYKVKLIPDETANNVVQYTPLALPYDKRCFSWNSFGNECDFHNGYSYAAELIPDSIVVSGVPFLLENKELLNGKICSGDTINLPEGNFNRLYILAAAATDKNISQGTFSAGNTSSTINIPSYTGFIGQWGHTDHTQGYLLDDEVAFIGTHRHSAEGDHPYEFTYMYKYYINIPVNSKQLILPNNPDIVIFAATLTNKGLDELMTLSPLFRTSNRVGSAPTASNR